MSSDDSESDLKSSSDVSEDTLNSEKDAENTLNSEKDAESIVIKPAKVFGGYRIKPACFYFKKRYSNRKLQQSLLEMAAESQVEILMNSLNSVKYGSIALDFSSADEQYTHMIKFIEETPEPFKSELSQIPYPVFVHLYLELIFIKKSKEALKFWHRHSAVFMKSEGYEEVVLDLKGIRTTQDITSHKYFSIFREDKYIIKISPESMKYLNNYLENLNHMIILQLLSLNILIATSDESMLISSSEKFDDNSSSSEKESVAASPSDSLTTLENCIRRLNERPPRVPSISLYSLSDVKKLHCADLSSNNEMLACGFEDSAVHVWNFKSPWYLKNCFTINDSDHRENGMPVAILRGHAEPVFGVAFIPNTDLLLSCSGDKTIRAWKLDTHSNEAIYFGHQREIWNVDVSTMRCYFATASKDNKGFLWTIERTYPINSFIGHQSEVNCIKFHPNCNYVATGSSDETIRLWSVQEGRIVRVFTGHSGGVYSLAFSPNGKYIASAGEDRQIKIWDLASATVLKNLRCHSDMVCSLNYNDNGSLLVSAGSGNIIRLYNMQDHSSSAGPSLYNSTNQYSRKLSSDEMFSFHTRNSSFELVRFSLQNTLSAVGVES